MATKRHSMDLQEFTAAEIKFETQSLNIDSDPANNVLTRKINAIAAPQHDGHGESEHQPGG